MVNPRFFLCLLSTLCCLSLCAACSDDRPKRRFVFYVPPSTPADMSPDVQVDGVVEVDMGSDPQCAARVNGEQCPLDNASGICLDGRCQLFACIVGYKNCDDDPTNGCEQDVTTSTFCGSCLRSCREQEQCQMGPRGPVCSSGVVCPTGRFDMDQDVQNGCEWVVDMDAPVDTQPETLFSVQSGVLLPPDQFVLAGRDAQYRYLLTHWTDLMQLMPLNDELGMPLPAEQPGRSAFSSDASGAVVGAVGWDDGQVTFARVLGMMGSVRTQPSTCALDAFSPDIKAIAASSNGDAIAYAQAQSIIVTPLTPSCLLAGDCTNDSKVFGVADYLRAFYPYADESTLISPEQIAEPRWRLSGAEVGSCLQCTVDRATGAFVDDRRCWGEAQCRAEAFDAGTTCVQCPTEAQQCPSFDPVHMRLSISTNRHVFFTQRGVVIVDSTDDGWVPVARFEMPFVPNQAQQGRVVTGDVRVEGNKTRIAYWHSDGYLRVLELVDDNGALTIVPGSADIGVRLKSNDNDLIRVVLGREDTLALTDGASLFVVGLRPRSAKIQKVVLSDTLNMFSILDIKATEDGFAILREELNQVLVRTVRLDQP